MNVGVSVETDPGCEALAERLVDGVREALSGRRVDLAVLFASAHFEDCLEAVALDTFDLLAPRVLIGNTAASVIGNAVEYERQPAITLWAASMPGSELTSFHLSQPDLERLGDPRELREHLGVSRDDEPNFLLIADPFSINPLETVQRLESAFPGRPIVGGVASAGDKPGQNCIVFDGQTLRHGAVGVALSGALQMDTVVSQGCRPIARHMVITKAERNVIHELGGRRALDVLSDILRECTPDDVGLVKKAGMFIGRAISSEHGEFERGDFLIRGLLGLDQKARTIHVNDLVQAGQIVQFHVLDAASAAGDMEDLLQPLSSQPAAGALMFTCTGRGTGLFARRHQDALAVCESQGPIPLAGFFAAGEIGPVGRSNYLHGHTASIAFFRDADVRARD